MSYSLVRTCDRCGTRAERPLSTRSGLAFAQAVLLRLSAGPINDQGCPSCDPDAAKAAGVDMERWRSEVALARGHRPS